MTPVFTRHWQRSSRAITLSYFSVKLEEQMRLALFTLINSDYLPPLTIVTYDRRHRKQAVAFINLT